MTAGFLLALMVAQSAPADTPQYDLQRIRKALDAPAAPLWGSVQREGPVFRITVEGFELDEAWKDRSGVPPYVRTWLRAYHHEHLEQVTPEEFRGATLYPYGLPVDVIVGYVVKQFSEARRKSQQKRAREAVRAELERFLACRAIPSTPDCRTKN